MTASPFSLGSDTWPGLSKLLEEAGEVIQVGGKLLGTGGEVKHWDGSDLASRLEEELADLRAAIVVFEHLNRERLNATAIGERANEKVHRFLLWHNGELV